MNVLPCLYDDLFEIPFNLEMAVLEITVLEIHILPDYPVLEIHIP